MHIERVPNRNSHPTILLRQSYREGRKVKKHTLANLTHWPESLVEGMQALLRGGAVAAGAKLEDCFEVVRSRAHGHVAAVLGTLRKIGLDKVITTKACRELNLVCALIVARILAPASKFSTARALDSETLSSSIAEELSLEAVDEDALYAALDWLLPRQEQIQRQLVAKHIKNATLVLYDLSSSYFEGRKCPLAHHGYSRDGKPHKLQIEYGLICNEEGCPVAIEVFEGNTSDPASFTPQVKRIREQYGVKTVVWVGDRGMITNARIDQDLRGQDGLEWITALRTVEIRGLINSGALQLSLFDKKDLAEITHPDYPGERFIACKNPLLAAERTRKREELLLATEQRMEKIALATKRSNRPLKGKDAIALRVGKVISRFKMEKHFKITITDNTFEYTRNLVAIDAEKALDGIYIVRTSMTAKILSSEQVVLAYKSLSKVERAFRSMKSVDLKIRPIFHHLADRVRAHVFLCMLSYYVEWHMRQKLASILFDDHDKPEAAAARTSVVAKAQISNSAKLKAARKVTQDGMPVQSFRSLLADLSSIVRNTIKPAIPNALTFEKITAPTHLQAKALSLLGVSL